MIIEKIIVKQTSTGKEYKSLTLKKKDGTTIANVSVWGFHPDYNRLTEGQEVQESELRQNDKGYWNLEAPKRVGGGNKPDIQAAQARKSEGIDKAMTRKERGMELAASQRDAVQLVIAFHPELAQIEEKKEKVEKIKAAVTYWRNWLLDNFGDATDPTYKPPFN